MTDQEDEGSEIAEPITPGDAAGDPTQPKGPSKANQANRERRAREIERRKSEAAAQEGRKRKKRLVTIMVAVVVVALVGAGIYASRTKPLKVQAVPTEGLGKLGTLVTATAGSPGAEGVAVPDGPVLADLSSMANGRVVNGVQCQASESLIYHIHAHLAIFINGHSRKIPEFIGIQSKKCLYWLHTHANDGIIHVESPDSHINTLGDFFDIWGQPLGATQVGPVTGVVTALYNGKHFTGKDIRAIPLQPHGEIQLDVGTPLVAPVPVNFGNVQ